MYKAHVKVYGEDLAVADVSQSSVDGVAQNAGGTLNALGVNVYAKTAVTISSTVTVEVFSDDVKNGSFATKEASITLPAGTYGEDDLIGQITLPVNVKNWVKGKVSGNSSSSGTVRVALDYLGR